MNSSHLSRGNSTCFSMGLVGFVASGLFMKWIVSRKQKKEERFSQFKLDEFDTKMVLVILSTIEEDISKDFSGSVITDLSKLPNISGKVVYLCGDIRKSKNLGLELAKRVYIIRALSHNIEDSPWSVVDRGRVPIRVHGVGVFYRRFFDPRLDMFNRIRADHMFQALTESTKPGTAHRTGIYLTPVQRSELGDLHFRLLRCSSNLAGPTGNFQTNDTRIVDALNEEADVLFKDAAPLNHVLAQIYINTPATAKKKQTKAAIKDHSDKTKDMPGNGIMAFVTFYENLNKLSPMPNDPYDYGYKGTSGLTQLCFRLKSVVAQRPGCNLTEKFSITLYPNSVFFMPLSTNRLYTHEIRPAKLNAEHLPTRMGYVVRCSNAEAVFTASGRTCLKVGKELVPLEKPTPEGMASLRQKYAEENRLDTIVDYGHVPFSMNQGDYLRPLEGKEEFRFFSIQTDGCNLYNELQTSAVFENVTKGRQGTVLVRPNEARGVPIVRTTTKYHTPAQCFQAIHMRIAQQIQEIASLPMEFNNALFENYSNEYATMGFHSDQALDLHPESFIAIYSCYQFPERAYPPRKLIVESKVYGGPSFEIPLSHNSVVLFSTITNKRFKHKIVLEHSKGRESNQWLGITFRTSKTFVNFRDSMACFEDGTPITLAEGRDSCREFFKMRKKENDEVDFCYPSLTYTISGSDLMPPKEP